MPRLDVVLEDRGGTHQRLVRVAEGGGGKVAVDLAGGGVSRVGKGNIGGSHKKVLILEGEHPQNGQPALAVAGRQEGSEEVEVLKRGVRNLRQHLHPEIAVIC